MYGVPLEQAVPIVSESGDIQGNLSINIQQCTGIDSVTLPYHGILSYVRSVLKLPSGL